MAKETKTGSRHNKGRRAVRIVMAALAAAAILTVTVNLIINQSFGVTFYQIRCAKIADDIRIVELADLHNQVFGDRNQKLVGAIRSLEPDLIVYAGDMINEEDGDYSVLFDLSDQLSEIAPIYACYGNNELRRYWRADKELPQKLAEHRVTLLSDEALDVAVGGNVLQFIAVTDDSEHFDIVGKSYYRSKAFLEQLEPTESCRVCLTHYPVLFRDKLLHQGIDVAFTGHAHGGLIRLPVLGGLFSPGEGFLPDFTSGVVTAEDGAQVVISRGLGNSVFLPRINNPPELVVVDLCPS